MKRDDIIGYAVIGLGVYLLLSRSSGHTALYEEMYNLPFVPPDERPNVLIKAMTVDQQPLPAPGTVRYVTPQSVQPRTSLLEGIPLKGHDARPAIRPASVLNTWQREGYWI